MPFSRLRGMGLVGVACVVILAAAFIALIGIEGAAPPSALWVPEARMNGGAGFEVREGDPTGAELREGWFQFVPAGTRGEFHLHYAAGRSGGLGAEFIGWSQQIVGTPGCVVYLATGQRMVLSERVWIEFMRERTSHENSH